MQARYCAARALVRVHNERDQLEAMVLISLALPARLLLASPWLTSPSFPPIIGATASTSPLDGAARSMALPKH
jgi:hypothetical protein